MDKTLLDTFVGKKVNLVYGRTNFGLHGVIETVTNDFILFRTNQTNSIISISEIKSVVLI